MKMFSVVSLLVGSEVLGLAIAELYHRLFLKAVPPVAMSGFNVGAAHAVFLLYGIGVGLVLFVWAMIAVGLSRLMGQGRQLPRTGVESR